MLKLWVKGSEIAVYGLSGLVLRVWVLGFRDKKL